MKPTMIFLLSAAATLVATLVATLSGCSRTEDMSDVVLPQTPVLSVRESWGVAEKPYVRVYVSPESDAEIVGHLRSGVVAEITERIVSVVGDGSEGWVQVRRDELVGWVDRREILLFETRERAENAAEVIRRD